MQEVQACICQFVCEYFSYKLEGGVLEFCVAAAAGKLHSQRWRQQATEVNSARVDVAFVKHPRCVCIHY